MYGARRLARPRKEGQLDTDTTQTAIFTPAELDTLNKARAILKDAEETLRDRREYDAGHVAAFCSVAEEHIFDVLNTLHAYGVQRLADDVVFGRRSAVDDSRLA